MATLEQRDFYEPPPEIVNKNQPHMALLFLVDTSYSMKDEPIRSLNDCLNRFKEEVCLDESTSDILDVAIVEFNSDKRVVQRFTPVGQMKSVSLVATGSTKMSPAIWEALEMVDARYRFYLNDAQPYKPWIVLISDGAPDEEDKPKIEEVAMKIKKMEAEGKLRFRSLGVKGCDWKILHQLSGEDVIQMDGYDFTGFFDWARKSMRAISSRAPENSETTPDVALGGNLSVHKNTVN